MFVLKKKAIIALLGSILLSTILFFTLKRIFPSFQLFVLLKNNCTIDCVKDVTSFINYLATISFHSLVMPNINYVLLDQKLNFLSIQNAGFTYGIAYGYIAFAIWALILFSGIYFSIKNILNSVIYQITWVSLVCFVSANIFTGGDTFISTIQTLPFIIIIASSGARSKIKPLVTVLVGCIIFYVFINNMMQFDIAVSYIEKIGSLLVR